MKEIFKKKDMQTLSLIEKKIFIISIKLFQVPFFFKIIAPFILPINHRKKYFHLKNS